MVKYSSIQLYETPMNKLKAEEDKLNLELENAHGKYAATKT